MDDVNITSKKHVQLANYSLFSRIQMYISLGMPINVAK
jgi:hypothetical protein